MKKLIYLNLFIDNDWDEEKILDSIFLIQIPSSKKILDSYLNLGIFLADKDDVVVVNDKVDEGFLNYLNQFFQTPKVVLENEIDGRELEQGLFAGISSKEESLISNFNLASQKLGSSFFKEVNSKFFLHNIAQSGSLSFPATKKIRLEDVLNDHIKGEKYFLKFPIGSGGRGVFYIDDSKLDLINVFNERIGDSKDIFLLKQSCIEVNHFLYTISDNSIKNFPTVVFEIFFDKNNNSYRHIPYNVSDNKIKEVVSQIADKLSEKNYHGPFGIDGIIDRDKIIYPAIDLNVRYDKSRIIFEAAKKIKINNYYFESVRRRFNRNSYLSFSEFWEEVMSKLSLDSKGYCANGLFFIPFLCSNMFNPIRNKHTVEITFFIGSTNKNVDKKIINEWLEMIDNTIGVVL